MLILEDPLDHVVADEKSQIIKSLTSEDKPWSIIVSSVDDIWNNHISKKVLLNNGVVTFHNLND